jgi:hypothetical protein
MTISIPASLRAALSKLDTMLPSFISKAIRDAEENEPVFERLKEEEQDGEVEDHQWPQYKHSQRHSQRHPKLWNAACFVLGTLLGVAGLLVSQQTTDRSVDVESIGPPNPAMPHSKYSIESRNVETDDRQYQW